MNRHDDGATPSGAHKVEFVHSGEVATLNWYPERNGWRAGWWCTVGDSTAPVPGDDVVAARQNAILYFIGERPPNDHAKICGGYVCVDCGAHHVRLWCAYPEGGHLTARCRACVLVHAGKRPSWGLDVYSIGWNMPAVPVADGSAFWPCQSVPAAAVTWWKELPESPPLSPRQAKRARCKSRRMVRRRRLRGPESFPANFRERFAESWGHAFGPLNAPEGAVEVDPCR